MKSNYRQKVVSSSRTHFSAAPMSDVEFSRMQSNPTHYTDFSAGDIVPIGAFEVLPNDTFDISIAFDIRQATVLVPTMGSMEVNIVAFEVPNRVINKSWKAVMGENISGSWTANEISLAPLVAPSSTSSVQVPVCSVADYYGYPTQAAIPGVILAQSHDLLFRGYLECYNSYFRDQNYQPPIPYSKLNVFNGFFVPTYSVGNDYINLYGAVSGQYTSSTVSTGTKSDGSFAAGAVVEALYGEGSKTDYNITVPGRKSSWSALARPLKANKLHDYFTSVLPSPQKGREIVIGGFNNVPVVALDSYHDVQSEPIHFVRPDRTQNLSSVVLGTDSGGDLSAYNASLTFGESGVFPDNLYALTSQLKDISLDELRMSAAIQQVYELLGRGGSRYVEYINTFFGLEVENPFDDIPTFLGRVRRNLDLYQVAQTAQGEGTSVGTLGAFGYTSNGGHLFTKTFKEHGYVHIFAIVRHRNIYPSLLSRDKMRMSMLDFYQPQLANISEQPVYSREINPFSQSAADDGVFGYQEAWAEYRYDTDMVTGHMRPGVSDTLAFWNYADSFDATLDIADGEFMKSNSAEVLNRSIAIPDTEQPQFKGQFAFKITKQRPMPTYSIPGLDII